MEKTEKYTVFRSPDDGHVYAVRNVEPRFTVRYKSDSKTNTVIFSDFLDTKPDTIKIAKMMRGIGEAIARFLKSEQRKEAGDE